MQEVLLLQNEPGGYLTDAPVGRYRPGAPPLPFLRHKSPILLPALFKTELTFSELL